MELQAWFALAVIVICFCTMAFTRWSADVVLMGGVAIFLVTGVLTPAQALAGFSNEGMMTVALLFIVSASLKETGAISWAAQNIFGRPKSQPHAQFRVMLPTAIMSGLLNNTPIVAMMIPAINEWARKHQLSVSKLMIPLSYAAIIGGTCTLIGTSTNLVVNGLLKSDTAYVEGLGMFDLIWIGGPCVVLTILYVLLVSKWLLPARKPAIDYSDNARQYVTEMLVEIDSPLIGKTIEQAGLRHLPGAYLIEVERDGLILPAVSPQEILYANDRLVFTGVVDSMVDMQKIRGLTPATDQLFKLHSARNDRCLIEAVVSNTCPLVGKSIREGRFRSYYSAAVIAVARNGEQVQKKIGDIVLNAGDTLLLETGRDFAGRHKNSRDFFLVSPINDSSPPHHEKAGVAVGILLLMVLLIASETLTMFVGALVAAMLMIFTRCVSASNARRSLDWTVLIVIAAAFAIGEAMRVSGASMGIANWLLGAAVGDPYLALSIIFFVTALLTSMITNNAAAVLMFPVAIAIANQLQVSLLPFVITIMIAASASFATPMGYQTNLMVQGPGGYHFKDYIKIGVPLTVLIGIVTIGVTPILWPF
ncbi:MAG TPA: SLC13 family permease [Gammaproteobacteria bacterium]|nr:SLC13 family permease [Gammaproteobacteria bacterium]